MKLTNKQMDEYFTALSNIAEKATGKLGYGIARNLRKLSEELVEYQTLNDKAIVKYGEPDDNGTSRIQVGSEAFQKYIQEMKEYMDIQHEVELFMVSQDDVMNSNLNAKEILAIDFMIM